ncbi:MAG: MoaD/ThiS family protein [Jatrophihabitantaceae bacterium]
MAAEITVRYWAGAHRAAGLAEEALTVETIADLRAALAARAGFDRLSTVVSFLVDGQQAGDSARLHRGAVVDVLPPFAGG